MKNTLHFNCEYCGHYDPALSTAGWTDGTGYRIVACPECNEENVTVPETDIYD